MNKSDLIQILSQKESLSETMATDIIDLIFDGFADELKKRGRVEIRGFGVFVVREYKTYMGRNPKTGSKIEIAPKKLPFFKVGKELKESLNNQRQERNTLDLFEGKGAARCSQMDILLGE